MNHEKDPTYKSNAWLSYFASRGELRQKGYDSAKTILHGGQFGMDRIFFQNIFWELRLTILIPERTSKNMPVAAIVNLSVCLSMESFC